jgi:hypothetical protein
VKFLRKYADNTRGGSVSNKFRKNRFLIIEEIISGLPKPVKILDAGGTLNFWKQMGYAGSREIELTILNLEHESSIDSNIKFITGDVRDLSRFKDKEFDIVFSNSVIEHVGGTDDRTKMANEIIRAGKIHCVQTPNYYFPFEPHYLFPFFQFLPKFLRIWLLMNFNLGWYSKCRTKSEAEENINSIHLLRKTELLNLFPGTKLIKERFMGLTKSFTVTSK